MQHSRNTQASTHATHAYNACNTHAQKVHATRLGCQGIQKKIRPSTSSPAGTSICQMLGPRMRADCNAVPKLNWSKSQKQNERRGILVARGTCIVMRRAHVDIPQLRKGLGRAYRSAHTAATAARMRTEYNGARLWANVGPVNGDGTGS